jgi:hypothetical protein
LDSPYLDPGQGGKEERRKSFSPNLLAVLLQLSFCRCSKELSLESDPERRQGDKEEKQFRFSPNLLAVLLQFSLRRC